MTDKEFENNVKALFAQLSKNGINEALLVPPPKGYKTKAKISPDGTLTLEKQ